MSWQIGSRGEIHGSDGQLAGGWNAQDGSGKVVKTKTPSANRRGITMSKAGNPAKYFS